MPNFSFFFKVTAKDIVKVCNLPIVKDQREIAPVLFNKNKTKQTKYPPPKKNYQTYEEVDILQPIRSLLP